MGLRLLVGLLATRHAMGAWATKLAEVEGLVASSQIVEDLGAISAEILETAPAPLATARLELVFAKQLRLLRERAIEKLRLNAEDFDAQCAIEAEFADDVQRSKPKFADWDSATEALSVGQAAGLLIEAKKRAADLQLAAAKQQARYMRLFQTFASRIQQLQTSQFRRGLPMQAGFAYRIQDSINLSGSYQQGRARLELQNIDDATVVLGDPPTIYAPSHGNFGFTFNAN